MCQLFCLQFNKKVAKHLFCKTCGICSHYRPRSNPDCVAVTIYCVDPSTPLKVLAVRNFHGQVGGRRDGCVVMLLLVHGNVWGRGMLAP